jgi:DNA-binding response OmpR family regulator
VPANILIVEDDPDILSSLAEVIREEGFDVETAANGYQALARLESRVPDLIFLDLMMPLMDGWKFLETARQRFPSAQPPVVLLSAVHNLTDEARRLGVTAYLSKPFDLEDVARMAHALTQRRSEGPRQGA